MSLPWFKAGTPKVRASISKHRWATRPPEWVMVHEVSALVHAGEMPQWSMRDLGARWGGIDRRAVRRVLVSWWAEVQSTTAASEVFECCTTTAQRFRLLASTEAPPEHHQSTTRAPRARVPLKEEEVDRDSLPDKPDDVAEAWALLSEAWTSSATGRRRIAMNKSRRVALTKHLHGTPSVDQTPIEDILTAWTWMLTSDHWRAVKCRSQGSIAVNTLLRHEHGGKLHEYLALAQEQPATTEDFAGEAVKWWAQVQKLTEAGAKIRNAAELYAASGGEGEPPARTLAAWTALDTIGRCSEVARTSRYDLSALRKRFESVYVQARSGLHVVEGGR
jgi:hypothetical protein